MVPNRTRVLVLQHPIESRHALNTARLAVLGLSNAALWVGEHFDGLEAVLVDATSAVLLFPSLPGAAEGEADNETRVPVQPQLLIVPDGTWRQARGIVRANPVLQALPRLDLAAQQPSRYRIRKTREPGALSTIEAVVQALTQLEPECDFQPVLRPFEKLVEQQIKAMGRAVYECHHRRE